MPKKVQEWVGARYGYTVNVKKPRPTDYFTVTSPLLTTDEKPCDVTKVKGKNVFVVFYWKSENGLATTLNPKIAINQFSNAFNVYANGKHMKEKLNGRTLEISIEKTPTRFSSRYESSGIFLIFGTIRKSKAYMAPEYSETVLRYTISGPQGKTGTINLPDNNKIRNDKFFEKMSTAYNDYLNAYDDNIKSAAKAAVEQIMTEL